MDKGISPEVVRSVLAERANLTSLAAKSAYKVSKSALNDYITCLPLFSDRVSSFSFTLAFLAVAKIISSVSVDSLLIVF